MLLREYAIEWWFIIPPLLTNVSALHRETWIRKLCLFSTSQACVFSWRMWVAACMREGQRSSLWTFATDRFCSEPYWSTAAASFFNCMAENQKGRQCFVWICHVCLHVLRQNFGARVSWNRTIFIGRQKSDDKNRPLSADFYRSCALALTLTEQWRTIWIIGYSTLYLLL